MSRSAAVQSELTYAKIAEAVEGAFGEGSIGLAGSAHGRVTETARSTFVRVSLRLIVRHRLEVLGDLSEDARVVSFKMNRQVREELADLLGVDENEVFRLHHHAAGQRAKSVFYRDTARGIERELAKTHGLDV